jgi:hypothetical protein
MQHRLPPKPEAEVLTESVAARLLTRASELDAARLAGVSVSELRAAALEAGISTQAFDAALAELQGAELQGAELQGAEQARVPDVSAQPRRAPKTRALAAKVTALVFAAGALILFLGRVTTVASAPPGPPLVEETVLLRCLSPGEAAALIRPLFGLRTDGVVLYAPQRAERVLIIRATPSQLRRAKAVLEEHEGTGSAACAARPPGTNPPR